MVGSDPELVSKLQLSRTQDSGLTQGLPRFSSLTMNQPGQGVGMEKPSYARNEPGECSRGHIAERVPTHAARSSSWMEALPKPGKLAVGDDLHPLDPHPA